MKVPSLRPVLCRGFSMVELLMVIGVIGVLAGIAIAAYSGITEAAKRTEAVDFAESLNRAVLRFNQANWDLPTAADPSASTDEYTVIRSLQYKWPIRSLKPGSPYFAKNYNPEASSDSNEFRLRWNGRNFEVLGPGTAGTGLLKTFTGADYTAADYAFPNGYQPAGMK